MSFALRTAPPFSVFLIAQLLVFICAFNVRYVDMCTGFCTQGSLSLNAWVDREGRDRTTTKILVRVPGLLLYLSFRIVCSATFLSWKTFLVRK